MSGANNQPQIASPLASRPPMSRGAKIALWAFGLPAALIGIVWLTNTPPPKPPQAPRQVSEAPGELGNPYPVRPEPVVARVLPQPALPAPASAPFNPLRSSEPIRPAPLMAFGSGVTPTSAQPGRTATEATAEPQAAPSGLQARLSVQRQGTAVAEMLPERNLWLSDGTAFPCLPDSPITSDVEGAFSCLVQAPIKGDSGNVDLFDAGTRISGQINGGLRRGQRRLFAVLTRITTPQGCRININAPAADALGQAGLDGDVDTHFFQRFGAYLGMAFLDAGMQAAVIAASQPARSSGGNVSFYQFQNAGRQGGQSLFAEDAAIPPTLGRGQARPIVVRLTQDIDLRPCYRLTAR